MHGFIYLIVDHENEERRSEKNNDLPYCDDR